MIKKLLVLIALSASLGFAQGTKYQFYAIDRTGRPIPYVNVFVCSQGSTGSLSSNPPCTPAVTVYKDRALTMPITQPVVGDVNGNYFFYVTATQTVDLVFESPAIQTYKQTDVPIAGGGLAVQAINSSATSTFNAALYGIFQVTLTSNVASSSVTNPTTGQVLLFNICQNNTGGWTFAWPTSFLNPPTVTSVANACTNAEFFYDGTNWRVTGTNVGGASGQVLSNQGNAEYGDANLTYNTSTKVLADTTGIFQSSIQDCGGQVFNVKCPTWGAAGDGVTNDHNAVAAAITAACVAGGTVYFPPGTYYIPSQITINCSNISLRGAGVHATTILMLGNTNYFLFYWTGTYTNVTISDMEINGASTGTSSTGSCIGFGKITGAWIERNYIHDCGTTSVVFDPNGTTAGSTNVFIDHNQFGPTHNGNAYSNIEVGNGGVNTFEISYNDITETTSSQIIIDINGAKNGRVIGNTITGTSFASIQLECGSGTTQHILISNNLLYSTSMINIDNGGANCEIQDVSVTHNIIHDSTTGAISIDTFNGTGTASMIDVLVDGNLIQNATGIGILVQNSANIPTFTDVVVQNNIIDGYGSGCSSPTVTAGIGTCSYGRTFTALVRANTIMGSGYGFQDARVAGVGSAAGIIQLKDNNVSSNTSGSYSTTNSGLDVLDNLDIYTSFTPNTASGSQNIGLPTGLPTVFLVSIGAHPVSGGNSAYNSWVGTVYEIAPTINTVVTQISATNNNQGLTSTLTISAATGNLFTITWANWPTSNGPIYVALKGIGFLGSPSF